MLDILKAVFTSPAVWTALLALANVILKVAWSDYSTDVWLAVSGLIVALLASLGIVGVEGVPAKVKRYKIEREWKRRPTIIH